MRLFSKSESSLWFPKFHVAPCIFVMVFAEKCFEKYQKSVCIYTHRDDYQWGRLINSLSLSVGKGHLAPALCPLSVGYHLMHCSTAASRLVCVSHLPGAMGWHATHRTEKHVARSLVLQLVPVMVQHVRCILPRDLMQTSNAPGRANV